MSKRIKSLKIETKTKELKHNPKKFKLGDKVRFIGINPDWRSSKHRYTCCLHDINDIFYITNHHYNKGKGEVCVVGTLPNQVNGYFCPSFALRKVE
jgi:hypothetical protein